MQVTITDILARSRWYSVAKKHVGDTLLTGPEIIHETSAKIIQTRATIKFVRGHQKSYADQRRKTLEFQVGDRVRLKSIPWKGLIWFRKHAKINPRYIVPFEILTKICLVAYRLKLPQELNNMHDTFHVSNLKKYSSSDTLNIPLDEIQIDSKLHFVEAPIEIMDKEIKD